MGLLGFEPRLAGLFITQSSTAGAGRPTWLDYSPM